MEARGLKSLPLAERRQVARAIERDPGIDVMYIEDGSVILIQCKAPRKEVDTGLRRLTKAMRMVKSDPEVMRGTPDYKGTRIPSCNRGHAVAGCDGKGDLVGDPALTREKVELAPMYVRAFPRRGRPAARPWAKRPPRRVSRRRLVSG